MNLPLNRNDFRLFRYVDNEIDIIVRNVDRKPVDLSALAGATIMLSDPKTRTTVMVRDLIYIDAKRGLCKFFITGDEVADLPSSTLEYGVVLTRGDGVEQLLYCDQAYNARGTVSVTDGPLPGPIEPLCISAEEFLTVSGKIIAGPYPAAAQTGNIGGQHSVVVDFTGYTGTFTVQGSLEPQPSTNDSDWFNMSSQSLIAQEGLIHVPFEGNIIWARFVVVPVAGAIVSALYRS